MALRLAGIGSWNCVQTVSAVEKKALRSVVMFRISVGGGESLQGMTVSLHNILKSGHK